MKILFLPHCLRNIKECDNKYDGYGLICNCEHNCSIGRLKKFAESKNFKVFIANGPSMVKKIVESENPDYVVGIACDPEIKLADEYLKVPHTPVRLLKDGCINTEVDEEEVKEVLNASPQIQTKNIKGY